MSTETTENMGFGPFGEVLAELMRTRDLTPNPETVRTLAIDAGMDPVDLEHAMHAEGGLSALSGDAHALSWVLSLSGPERDVFARGFAGIGVPATGEAVREARRSPEHAAERAQPFGRYPTQLPRPLVRYFDLEYLECGMSMPCWVGHKPEYVGRCPRDATMEVYDINLCSVHGAEAAAGAREELTQDAATALEGVGDPLSSKANSALFRANTKARLYLTEESDKAAEAADDLLRAAYPDPPVRNDFEIPHHHALGAELESRDIGEPWVDLLRASRHHIHALMRQAYQQGEDGIVDHLEDEREGTAVLLSYAIGVRDGLYPEHVEKARRDERENPLFGASG
jgi:hypothetical protein